MSPCKLQWLLDKLDPIVANGAIETWHPPYLPGSSVNEQKNKESGPNLVSSPASPRPNRHFSFPQSKLREIFETELNDHKVFHGLLFPTCECNLCNCAKSGAIFNINVIPESSTEGKLPISYLQKQILDSYLQSFFWLIKNRIPWYILYLIHNQSKDIPNASAMYSLKRFDLGVLGVDRRDYCRIKSSTTGVEFVLRFNDQDDTTERPGGTELKTNILRGKIHETLLSSHPQYFMKDIFSQPRTVHILEENDSLPILADVAILNRGGTDGADGHHSPGEALIVFVGIEGHGSSVHESFFQPQYKARAEGEDTTFGTPTYRPFVVKVFKELSQGVREWWVVNKAVKRAPKAHRPSVLAPLSAFFCRGRFCIVYPRAICSLEQYLTITLKQARPQIQIPIEKLWHEVGKLAKTLVSLHKKRCFHLDLTLANLMVMPHGYLTVADFGEMGIPKSKVPSVLKQLQIPDLELYKKDLHGTTFGDPPARTFSDRTGLRGNPQRSEAEKTKQLLNTCKSHDLYSFGQICFEAAMYTILGIERPRLYRSLRLEHEDTSLLQRALYRTCKDGRSVEIKKTVDDLLNELARSKEYEKKIDGRGLSRIIRNLFDTNPEARIKEGPKLAARIFQCLMQHSNQRCLINQCEDEDEDAPGTPRTFAAKSKM
ncbi:hypothetical protein TWF481_001176 [Arthrobotrys musiformis]|uniref:EKC/KEOPS complex subunit BUD32 n=1 Tax=Arthrobotrys musiformis TaxID=47236 RepID=A0AAV9WPX1_9PEZI